MEETDVCHPIEFAVALQPPVVVACAAKALTPTQRQEIAVHALGGTPCITHLAAQCQVSRKFVYHQMDIASEALEQAFAPPLDDDDKVLVYLPVTKSWLRQV